MFGQKKMIHCLKSSLRGNALNQDVTVFRSKIQVKTGKLKRAGVPVRFGLEQMQPDLVFLTYVTGGAMKGDKRLEN